MRFTNECSSPLYSEGGRGQGKSGDGEERERGVTGGVSLGHQRTGVTAAAPQGNKGSGKRALGLRLVNVAYRQSDVVGVGFGRP